MKNNFKFLGTMFVAAGLLSLGCLSAAAAPQNPEAPAPAATNAAAEEYDQPFMIADSMPKFQGGDLKTFKDWAESQIVYPAQALKRKIQGLVVLSFIIEKDGAVSNGKVLMTPDRLLSNEACRILESSPIWTPGSQRGTKVRVKYTIPIDFSIPKPPKKGKDR